MVFFGGADGLVVAFNPKIEPRPAAATQPATLRCLWKHDCNPMDMQVRDGKPILYRMNYGPCEVIATPVFWKNRVYIAVSRPRRQPGRGAL